MTKMLPKFRPVYNKRPAMYTNFLIIRGGLRIFSTDFLNMLINKPSFKIMKLICHVYWENKSKYDLKSKYLSWIFKKKNFTFIKSAFDNNLRFFTTFGPKQIEAIRFQNGFYDKSAQTDCSKEMWIPILKGLKHLNT